MSNNSPRRVVCKPTWVANSFLIRARNDDIQDLDPLKIQKLTYNLHGWNLAVTGSSIIGETFETWPHGPVCASIYHQSKDFKFRTISGYAQDIDPSTRQQPATYVNPADLSFYDIFDRAWERYKSYSGQQLSDFTPAVGTPWSYASENVLQYIPDNIVRDHFIEFSQNVQ